MLRVALCALAAASLLSCTSRRNADQRSIAELRVPLPREIQSLDPAEGIDVAASNVIRQVYEGLVEYDPATLTVVPRMARSWRVSDDGLAWTFELHPGMRFADDACFPGGRGREVTAEDVRYSVERAFGSPENNRGFIDAPPLAGLPEFLAGAVPHVSGLTVKGDLEVEFRLARPDPTLPHFLAQTRCRVVPREAVSLYGEGFGRHAVGTGPFRLVAWEPLSGILLVRNRGYWQHDAGGRALPHIDALRFVPIWRGDQHRLFAEGRIDMIYSYVRGIEAPEGPSAGNVGPAPEQRYFVTRLNTIYVRIDYRSTHPLVQDRRLRQVLSCALPRPTTTNHLPARGLLPPGLPGYDPALPGQHTDMEEARRLLGEAGHPGGRGLAPFRIAWRAWDLGMGAHYAESLRALGLEVELQSYDDSEYQAAIRAGRADIFRDGWMADYPDAQNFLELFGSGYRRREGGYSNPEYDRLLEDLRLESDPGRRAELARRMERILVADTAALFLDHERESQFVSPRVVDWAPNCTNPLNVCFYERVRLEPAGADTLR